MLSVLIHTLGCKLNQLESEALADTFRQAGFVLHEQAAKTSPSIIVINTCTVTSKADQKARRVIRKALRDYPDSLVLVTGCYAQLNKPDILDLEKAQKSRLFVLKGSQKENILDLPALFDEETGLHGLLMELCEENNALSTQQAFQFSPERFSSHTRSFLKIQDGCDNHCTYCRIRLARGNSVSLDPDQVLERLRILEQNHAEAVLTGVNICQYRFEEDFTQRRKGTEDTEEEERGRFLDNRDCGNLGELLEYLLAGTQKIALRLSSLEPDFIDENFAKILSNKRICPHFHLSIQSGSGKIIKKMGRNYNAETIRKAVNLLRGAKDDPFIACDIITGFPGETNDEFEQTFNLCKELNFAWIHVFPYSKRPGTPAYSYSQTIQESEVTKRVKLFADLAWQGRTGYVKRWLGREVDVLVEKSPLRFGAVSKEQLAISSNQTTVCHGVSENYLKLLVQYNGQKPLPGTVLRCKLPFDQKIDCYKNKHDALAEII
jgi:threonylcarbamoyladenosine tRNA methylthiotransferase MtaB